MSVQNNDNSFVGLLGVNKLVSLKGDPSHKDTIHIRPKHTSTFDKNCEDISNNVLDLLLKTGVYYVGIDYNSSIFKTLSVFSPFGFEYHDGKNLLDKKYLEEQYPFLNYKVKHLEILDFYKTYNDSNLAKFIPDFWLQVIEKKTKFSLPNEDLLYNVIHNIRKLRHIEGFYLKSFELNITQNTICLAFNCDGVTIMDLNDFEEFVNSIL
jgi:hypothetical protein